MNNYNEINNIVNEYTIDDQNSPSISKLTNGGFVLAYHSKMQNGNGYDIVIQIYDVFGNKFLTKVIDDIQDLEKDQKHPTVSEIAKNKFVVAWVSDNTNIHSQIFLSTGEKVGEKIIIKQNANLCYESDIAPLSSDSILDSAFIISWTAWAGVERHGRYCSLFAGMYNSLGEIIFEENLVSDNNDNTRWHPYVNSNSTHLCIVYNADDGIRGQLCNSQVHAVTYDVLGGKSSNVTIQDEISQISPTLPCYGRFSSTSVYTSNSIVYLWENQDGNGNWQIFLKNYVDNIPVTNAIQVTSSLNGYHNVNPKAITVSNDKIFLAYHQFSLNSLEDCIFVEVIDSIGIRVTEPIKVNAGNAVNRAFSLTDYDLLSIDKLSNRDIILGWTCLDSSGYGVCIQRFDSNGNLINLILPTPQPTEIPSSTPTKVPTHIPSEQPTDNYVQLTYAPTGATIIAIPCFNLKENITCTREWIQFEGSGRLDLACKCDDGSIAIYANRGDKLEYIGFLGEGNYPNNCTSGE